MILSKAFELYEKDKKLLNYSPYTLKSYKIQSQLLIRHLGDIDLKDIDLNMLKNYQLYSMDGRKPATVAFRIKFIRSLFRWANEEWHIIKNPSIRLMEPKMGQRIPKFLTEEQIEELNSGCVKPLEHALTSTFYATGCRIGELQRIDKKDINWEKYSIIVLGKGDKQREVYFDARCAIWLKKYLKSRNDDCEALFVTERRPYRRFSISQIRYIVKRIAKRSEIDINVFPHKYRHSLATRLLDKSNDIEFVRTILGHANVNTTLLYCSVSGERRREMYNKYF